MIQQEYAQSKPMTLAEEKAALKAKMKQDFKKKKPVKYKKKAEDILNDPLRKCPHLVIIADPTLDTP